MQQLQRSTEEVTDRPLHSDSAALPRCGGHTSYVLAAFSILETRGQKHNLQRLVTVCCSTVLDNKRSKFVYSALPVWPATALTSTPFFAPRHALPPVAHRREGFEVKWVARPLLQPHNAHTWPLTSFVVLPRLVCLLQTNKQGVPYPVSTRLRADVAHKEERCTAKTGL